MPISSNHFCSGNTRNKKELIYEFNMIKLGDVKMKNTLEKFFQHYKQQITIEELIKKLKIKKTDLDELLDNLYQLEKEGKIFFDKNKTYMHVPDEFCYIHGTLKKSNNNKYYIKQKDGTITVFEKNLTAKEGNIVFATKNKTNHPKLFMGEIKRIVKREKISNHFNYIIKETLKKDGNNFYITLDDSRIYIPKEHIHTAFVGDIVNVVIQNHTGCVIEVLKRHHKEHVFRCTRINGELKWVPIGASYGFYDIKKNNFKENDIVIAEIIGNNLKIVQKLKHNNTTQNDIDALIIDFGFKEEFPIQVIEEANKFSKQISKADTKNRIDLRNLETFTIDPIDAKDLDDAVSLEYKEDMYHLYVHTANPSHYIKVSSPIFKEALKRAFSIYPTTDVIPMLPELFSSGICSLNEDGDKLALTCKMDIDKNGILKDFNIFKSIIHSNKQMDYDTVNEFLKDSSNLEYLPFTKTLLKMSELSHILQKNKANRGALSLESEEKQFILDLNKEPTEIIEKEQGEAQQIIENFMLLANETIAKYAYYLGLPYIYRNHEKPTMQKTLNLKQNLVQKGYFIQKIGNIDNPEILQHFLNNLLKGKTKDEKKVICEVVLKSMSRAFYDDKNIGHYGLALDCYGTFTSPARKCSDLLNHMIIEEFLDNGIESEKLRIYKELIHDTCGYLSEKQKDADMLEQEINELMLKKYAQNFIDKEVSARILFINHSGIYIKEEHGLTGVIEINKNAILKGNNILYQNHEYKPNEQISVILKEINDQELIFCINTSREKKKTKKKG